MKLEPANGTSSPLKPALAAEDDMLAEEDREEAKKVEIMEDDETKVQDAMPERWGEGDEMNTTV